MSEKNDATKLHSTVRNSEELYAELDRYSAATGIGRTAIIRIAVKDYMRRNPIEDQIFFDELCEKEKAESLKP